LSQAKACESPGKEFSESLGSAWAGLGTLPIFPVTAGVCGALDDGAQATAEFSPRAVEGFSLPTRPLANALGRDSPVPEVPGKEMPYRSAVQGGSWRVS